MSTLTKQCIICSTEFTTDKFHPGKKFCSRKCLLVDWRNRHREQINEYSRNRAKTAPKVRSEIGRKYHASEKGQARYKLWRDANKERIMQKMHERWKNDPHVKAVQASRQKANALLKKAPNVPYVCNGCDSRKRLHAHHKNLDPFNNSLDNLMWLCHWCHARIHAEIREATL